MKPLKLTMQAFGSYGEKTIIDFTKPNQNLFLVAGNTGAGKTTIFDAIVFAIYGEAGSGTNRKNGTELQSQFTELGTEPYVELTFSERKGEDREVFTVRRIPRHLRPLRRGSGVKSESEQVSLTMPDGTEYPQKETNKKLEEIVGLTKNQFMQVAMIAQGEFMELLRARSDDKKLIFRKLFHTELFQDITEELGRRKKGKEKEIAVIKTECRTEAAHVAIPEEYEGAEELAGLKRQILNGEMTVIGQFLEELKALCEYLEERKRLAEAACQNAGSLRDEKRDAYTNAKNLLKFYEQLERAEGELSECKGNEDAIKETEILLRKLHGAYDVKAVYDRYEDVVKSVDRIQAERTRCQEAFPGLQEMAEKAAEEETKAKKAFDKELEAYSRIAERVAKAYEQFERIKQAGIETERKETAYKKAEKEARVKQEELEKLKEQELAWRGQEQELADTEKKLIIWNRKSEEIDSLEAAAGKISSVQEEVEARRESAEQSKKEYVGISETYEKEQTKYEVIRKAFLDAQAGFLARELKPGKPCPVCGALEHPQPCQVTEAHQEYSREMLDALEKKVHTLRAKQEELAAEARAESVLLAEKENTLSELAESLCLRVQTFCHTYADGQADFMGQKLKENDREIIGVPALEQMKALIEEWKKAAIVEGDKFSEDLKLLKWIQKRLKAAEEKKTEMKDAIEAAKEAKAEAAAALEAARAALFSFESTKVYPTQEAADREQKEAGRKKIEKEEAFQTSAKAADKAREQRDHCNALLQKYLQELPEQVALCSQRRLEYEQILRSTKLTEHEWKKLAAAYSKEDGEKLQREVEVYKQRKNSAETMQTSARKAIGDQPRPVLETVKREMETAEKKRQEAEGLLEQCRAEYKSNMTAYSLLAPKLEERGKTVEEHAKLDTMYRMISGNVSGSRMDLETYVQRYYLKKILYAANSRFYEMSAGQFELRMYQLEKAGEGKNKGLDLMVYSTVTGKEREIRTLSGGESFMAALSLALGMADQIQQSSAAVSLDMMFIDEGFGSLDEQSRTQAVKVLKNMAGGTKLVGIISHVSELKQEIEDQLIVSKDENGSHIKWQIS